MVLTVGTFKEGTEGGIAIDDWVFDSLPNGEPVSYTYEELRTLAISAGTYSLVPGDITDKSPRGKWEARKTT